MPRPIIPLAKLVRRRAPFVAVPPAAAGLSELTGFGGNPGRLRALIHLPASLSPGAALVVVLHGCNQAAASYAQAAGWVALADRCGFALLLPEQLRANNPNNCFNWFDPAKIARGRGEAASIRQMIAAMLERHRLDAKQVFVSGLSAGGAMAGALLAAYPEVFAGGAIIAGLPVGVAHDVNEAFAAMAGHRLNPAVRPGDPLRQAAAAEGNAHTGAWPTVSIWHGNADHVVAPSNASALEAQWLDVHGLARTAPREAMLDGARHRGWHDAGGIMRVESFTIPGMGHGTPIAPHAADPERRGGQAAPFVLDAGIFSSWHSLARWGLLRDAAPLPAEAPRAAPSEAPRWEPGAVIERALRAAGLR